MTLVFTCSYREKLAILWPNWTLWSQPENQNIDQNLKHLQMNVTRWSSVFHMVNRYFELVEHLSIFFEWSACFSMLLTPRENQKLEALRASCQKLDFVLLALQRDSIDLDARILLDGFLSWGWGNLGKWVFFLFPKRRQLKF